MPDPSLFKKYEGLRGRLDRPVCLTTKLAGILHLCGIAQLRPPGLSILSTLCALLAVWLRYVTAHVVRKKGLRDDSDFDSCVDGPFWARGNLKR